MDNAPENVEKHYGRGRILDSIVASLRQMGKDPDHLKPEDLAPVDEFHVRGREATVELAGRGALRPGMRVLDVGCGLGGSARYLALEHGCQVTGIDLTEEYVDVANALAKRIGLSDKIRFQQANAVAMPFADASFDVAWTQHVQMNIADKAGFYREIGRVTAPGGKFLFHDIFAGDGGPLHFPVPWAEDASISFLATPAQVKTMLEGSGFVVREWVDTTQASLQWTLGVIERVKASGMPPLGIHLLMGATAKAKIETVVRNMREGRIVVAQACVEKR
jgi:SAM-dependent methyltransferase